MSPSLTLPLAEVFPSVFAKVPDRPGIGIEKRETPQLPLRISGASPDQATSPLGSTTKGAFWEAGPGLDAVPTAAPFGSVAVSATVQPLDKSIAPGLAARAGAARARRMAT